MKKIAFALLALLVLSSCKDDDDNNGGDSQSQSGARIFIGIEGTSPNGISSLATYNRVAQTVDNNVFRKANINPMGSQLSDVMYDEDQSQLVLLVPGSEKIIFIDANTYEIKRQVKDLMQVRSVAKVSDFLYYVSSPGLGGLYVINALKGNIRAELEIDGITNPSAIEVYEDMAFIANSGDAITKDSTVTVMRTSTDTIITTLMVGHSPNSFVVDDENQLWILCSGEYDSGNPLLSGVASLWTYNLDTLKMAIDSSLAILPDTVRYFTDNQLRPNSMQLDDASDNLYFINNLPTGAITATNKNARTINEVPMIDDRFYGIAFDPANMELYGLRTPSDIEQDGFLEVFDPLGNKNVSIRIGVKPTDVIFK